MRQFRLLITVLACVVLSSVIGINGAVFSGLSDLRFRILAQPTSGQVAVVAIDSKSIEKMGVWPWPRRVYADLLAKLQEAEVADIAYDIDFSSASNAQNDEALARALEKAGGSVMLPVFKQYHTGAGGQKTLHTTFPLAKFRENSWLVTVNVKPETDGQVRGYRFGETINGEFIPSMASLLAGKFDARQGRFSIDFAMTPRSIPRFSFTDVLSGRVGKKELSGRRIIVGGTAAELGDRFVVPTYGVISGPVLQAMAAESILQNRALSTSGFTATLVGLAILSVLSAFLLCRLNLTMRAIILLSIALAVEALALSAQAVAPVIVDTSLILIAIVSYLSLSVIQEIGVYKILATLGQRRFQTIAHSLGDGIICTDQDGMITFCNAGAEDMFGYPADDVIGMPVTALFDGTFDHVFHSVDCHTHGNANQGPLPSRTTSELLGSRKDGSTFDVEICLTQWEVDKTVSFGVSVRDITARKREQKRIKYLAEHDTLTGLANRSQFGASLAQAVTNAEATDGEFAVLIVDLDDFKIVNDTFGHQAGDKLLQEIARALQATSRGSLIARMGGDEFTVVVEAEDARQRAADLAEEISQTLKSMQPSIDGQRVSAQASIGISVYPSDGLEADTLLANADLALYASKARRNGSFAFYTSEIRAAMTNRLQREEELQDAFTNRRFELHYQPQVDMAGGRIVGAEALIRWRHHSGRLALPGEFMPIVNSSSLSDSVADWVLETAVRQARNWELQGRGVRVGVNISPSQLTAGELHTRVEGLLRETGLSPTLLELELTEDILIENTTETAETLLRIQAMGVGIAFDDFGTGYASLTYLKDLPLDRLKIDQSFVKNMMSDDQDAVIVRALIDLCKGMNLSIIAEGIEDSEALDILREMGCDEGQGYYFSRPIPPEEFVELQRQYAADKQSASIMKTDPIRRTA